MSMKNPLTPAGIEPATFRFVAQHLNHCSTAVPSKLNSGKKIISVPKRPDRHRRPRTLLFGGHVSLPRDKSSKPSLTSSADVKNNWSSPSTPSIHLLGV